MSYFITICNIYSKINMFKKKYIGCSSNSCRPHKNYFLVDKNKEKIMSTRIRYIFFLQTSN